ncbi:MAG: lysophospholipase [Solirubrobacteraceae bacterium]
MSVISSEGSFRGVRARRISWRSWLPAGNQPLKGVISIAHGYGEHTGRYGHVALRLCEAGYAVYGPDHRGHGRSQGKPGRISVAAAVADLDQMVVTVARKRHPDQPQFLLGHSMGGLIALHYATAHQQRLTGLVLSAPLAKVDGGPLLLAIGRVMGLIAPGAQVSQVDPRLVSRDHQVVTGYIADPLNYHGRIPAAVARDFIRSTAGLDQLAASVRLPTLLQWGTADRLCPTEGSQMLADRLGTEDLTVIQYPGAFHEIYNEPEREQVINDLLAWLSAHIANGTD